MKYQFNSIISISAEHLRLFALAIVFYLCFGPFTLVTASGGISANYFFILVPIIYLLKDLKIYLPNKDLNMLMMCFISIFILSVIFQPNHWDILHRKFISFLLFMTAFSFAFMRINAQMILAFKIGLILFTTYLALDNFLEYRSFDADELGYAAKDQVGNQRFGFMFVFAFWVTLFLKTQSRFLNLVKIPILILLFTGIFLTFSRSSVVAFAGSLFFLFFHFVRSTKIFNLRLIISIFIYTTILFLIVFFTGYYEYLSVPFEFFGDKLDELLSGDGINLSNTYSSEGYRIYLIREILNYVSGSPLFGSGYLGIWYILPEGIGSAHGQYNDILFRTGFIGLILYGYLLIKLSGFLRSKDLCMYVGFWGILVFGLFHETFKLGHGAFIFAFIIGMWASSLRDKHINQAS